MESTALNHGILKWKTLRSFPRFALQVPLQLIGSRNQPLGGTMVDIGLGGMCVAFVEALPAPGERALVEFSLPNTEERLRIMAKVRYTSPERTGLQFLNITAEQREYIRRACADLIIV